MPGNTTLLAPCCHLHTQTLFSQITFDFLTFNPPWGQTPPSPPSYMPGLYLPGGTHTHICMYNTYEICRLFFFSPHPITLMRSPFQVSSDNPMSKHRQSSFKSLPSSLIATGGTVIVKSFLLLSTSDMLFFFFGPVCLFTQPRARLMALNSNL